MLFPILLFCKGAALLASVSAIVCRIIKLAYYTLGYSDFNNLDVLGCCIDGCKISFSATFIKSTFCSFLPFCPRLASSVGKNANMIQKCFFTEIKYEYQKHRI